VTTGQQDCERILAHWREHHPRLAARYATWQAIWESSPTGELYQVWEWLQEVRIHEGEHVVLKVGDVVVGEWNRPQGGVDAVTDAVNPAGKSPDRA
jgi:hypothetical protein